MKYLHVAILIFFYNLLEGCRIRGEFKALRTMRPLGQQTSEGGKVMLNIYFDFIKRCRYQHNF